MNPKGILGTYVKSNNRCNIMNLPFNIQIPTKTQLINAMPVIAFIAIVVCAFLPVNNVLLIYIGLALGATCAIIFPYIREWKKSGETLKFTLEYLIPIIIAILIVVAGISYEELYLWILAETIGFPSIVAYGVAVIVAYGGKAMFIGLKNNIPFLGDFRLGSLGSIVETDVTISDKSNEIPPDNIHEEDDIQSDDTKPVMI